MADLRAQIRVELDMVELDPDVAEDMIRKALHSMGDIRSVNISKIITIRAQMIFATEVVVSLPAEDLLTEEGKAASREVLQTLAIEKANAETLLPIISSAQIVELDGAESELTIFNDK